MKKLFVLIVASLILAGCAEEKMPEPNAATCAPGAFEAALKEMRSEANRAAFTEECKSFQKAQKMREWKFVPSPKNDY